MPLCGCSAHLLHHHVRSACLLPSLGMYVGSHLRAPAGAAPVLVRTFLRALPSGPRSPRRAPPTLGCRHPWRARAPAPRRKAPRVRLQPPVPCSPTLLLRMRKREASSRARPVLGSQHSGQPASSRRPEMCVRSQGACLVCSAGGRALAPPPEARPRQRPAHTIRRASRKCHGRPPPPPLAISLELPGGTGAGPPPRRLQRPHYGSASAEQPGLVGVTPFGL